MATKQGQAVVIAGHFGLACAVKAREPSTPLWALMVATIWLDIVFVPMFASRVESFEQIPGASSYGGAIIHADYTHSLVGATVLSLGLGMIAAWVWGRQSGIVIALVASSHWLLDLIVHRADLTLLPGNAGNLPKFGFGLWRWPVGSAVLELVLVVFGAFLYWRAAKKVALAAGRGERLATANGIMALSFGILILALDVTGLGG